MDNHASNYLNHRIEIPRPQGELLPAEERLANVLKAIEDRLLKERAELDTLEDMYGEGHTNMGDLQCQRGFLAGLDIAWSIAKTEILRRTDG